jgi:hypothetical protein
MSRVPDIILGLVHLMEGRKRDREGTVVWLAALNPAFRGRRSSDWRSASTDRCCSMRAVIERYQAMQAKQTAARQRGLTGAPAGWRTD